MHVCERNYRQKKELGTTRIDRADKKLLASNGHLESHLVFTTSSIV